MTVITVNALETMLGGAAAAAKAYIKIDYRMAGEQPAATVDGADVTLARTIEVNIVAGVPEVPVDAPATIEDVTYAHVTVGSKMPGTPVVGMDVIIPASETPVDVGALVVVDPASFEIVQPGSTVAQMLALKANADAVYSKTAADERFATAEQGGKADSAYQKPESGVPATDLAEAVRTSLGKADSAYQKPAEGVPGSDLTEAVRTSLAKADVAVPNTVEGRTALAASPELGAAYAPILNGIQDVIGLIRTDQQDVNFLLIGDSTTAMSDSWAYQLPGELAELFPTHSIVEVRWDYTGGLAWLSPTTIATGTGDHTIYVWNAGVPGQWWSNQLNAVRRDTIMTAADFDLLIFNHGHNVTNGAGEPNWHALRDLTVLSIERFREQAQNAAVLVMSQNPRTDYPGRAETLADIYRRICAERGYAFLDVTQVFTDYVTAGGATLPELVNSVDNVHPTTEGFGLWIAALVSMFASVTRSQSIPRKKPALGAGARNLLPNGEASLTGSNEWTWVNVTVEESATHVRSRATSLKLSKTANGSVAYGWVALPVEEIRGKWITFTQVLYMESAAAGQTGQIGLYSNAGAIELGRTDNSQNRDQWTIRSVSAFIPNDVTYVRAYVNVDAVGASDTTVMWVDYQSVTFGTYPTLGAVSSPSVPSRFIPASRFYAYTGTPTVSDPTSVAGKAPAWLLDPSTSESVAVIVDPSEMVGWRSFAAYAVFSPTSTGGGDVRLDYWEGRVTLDSVPSASTVNAVTAAVGSTAWAVKSTIVASGRTVGSDPLLIRVRRYADNAADTFGSDLALLGVRIVRTS